MNNKTRLFEIIKLIDRDKIVIDIGTDHGLVPLYLSKNNISKEIIATDISKKSLKKLEDQLDNQTKKIITTVVTDGFNGLEIRKNQVAIIAGMGANTVINIIDSNLEFARSLEYMIIESNVGNEKLRKYLNDLSFTIIDDFIVHENKKYYDIMKVKNGKDVEYNLSEIYFGKKNIDNHNKMLEEKLEIEYPKNLKFKSDILKNSKKKDGIEVIEERIKAIEEVYAKWKLEI